MNLLIFGLIGPIGLGEFLILLVLLGAYILPTIVAIARKKRNRVPIALVNILLGWSVIGWIVALVWAFAVDTPQGAPSRPPSEPIS